VRMGRRILLFSKRQGRVKRIRLLPPDLLGLANTRLSPFLRYEQFS